MNDSEITTAISTISYKVESMNYCLNVKSWQDEVFKQIEKDASMVGLSVEMSDQQSLSERFEVLKKLLTQLLMSGDVRSFLYRIDVSEKKIRQIENLSVDDLCILVLEREFRKVCIRKHFSPR